MKLNHDLFWRAFVTYRLTCGGPRTTTDVNKAFRHFVGLTEKQFANYLGVVMLNRMSWKPGVMHLRKSAVDKIMQLNSPHWYAILKARDARGGTKKCEN